MEQWKKEYLEGTVGGIIRKFGTKEKPITAKEIAEKVHMSVSYVYKQVAIWKRYNDSFISPPRGYYYEK